MAAPRRCTRARAVGLASAAVLLAACADIRAPLARSPRGGVELPADSSVEQPEEGSLEEIEPIRYQPGALPSPPAPAAEADTSTFRAPIPPLAADSPALRRAALSDAECLKEIARSKLPFEAVAQASDGVAAPLRLTGSLRGIRFVVPPASSPHGVLDCRLALALDDLASVLAGFEVVEVRVDNFYRKNAVLPAGSKKGKQAKRRAKPSQHSRALAADITSLTLADGRTLTIPRDWHAPIGSTSCGPDARLDAPNADSTLLRDMICEVARKGIFHRVLTPSFNAAHQGHFHFDLGRGDTTATIR